MKINVLYRDDKPVQIEVYSDAWVRRLFGVEAPPMPDIDEDTPDLEPWEVHNEL